MSSTLNPDHLRDRYQAAKAKALDLDMTRGKPCAEQLDLSLPLLHCLGPADYRAADGTDTRNYGLVDGLPEAKQLFADILGTAPSQVILGDNASLSLMYDVVSEAFHRGMPGGARPWSREPAVKILCPSPGYDRHFALCEYLGADTVAVSIDDHGPDLDEVSRLAADDPSVKAIFCVPRYSNPTGITYGADAVSRARAHEDRGAGLPHHLGQRLRGAPPLSRPRAAGRHRRGVPRRRVIPTARSSSPRPRRSRSPARASSAIAGSDANMSWFRASRSEAHDRPRQGHAAAPRPVPARSRRPRRAHGEARRDPAPEVRGGGGDPRARARRDRRRVLEPPRGGYFISLDVPDGCATRVVERAKEAGVKLTGAGATFPRGKDPRNRNIRIAPSFPPLAELRQATEILALSVLLVAAENGAVLSGVTAGATAR